MAYIVRDLPSLIATSSGSTNTTGIGLLDDAASITIFMTSSSVAGSTAATIQVSQFDPSLSFPQPGVTQSSGFFNASSSALATATTGANVIVLSNISFRGLRITGLSSAVASEVIARVSKQVSV